MDKKVTSIISYIGIVGWLIAYFAGDKEGAKLHLNQALILALTGIGISVLYSISLFIPFFGGILRLLLSLLSLGVFAFSIIGIIYAAQDQDKPLPIIGELNILH